MSGVFGKLAGVFSSNAARLKRAEDMIAGGDRTAAFKLLVPLAQASLPRAEFLVGRSYLEGAGVPHSVRDGAYWLERAAEHGDTQAPGLLAALHVQGLIGPNTSKDADASGLSANGASSVLFGVLDTAVPDFVQALKWARRAAAAGTPDGQALLAYILTSGPEDMRDPVEAERLYHLSAMAKCAQGCLGYGLALLKKNDPSVDAEAYRWMIIAAEADLATAYYLLGVMTQEGRGVEADLPTAVTYYREAAIRNLRVAQARYGLALFEGIEKNVQEGESWLRRAALQGDTDAAAIVGDLYARGGDLPPNHAEAAMWYRRAAEGGHRAAARALGLMHLNGLGTPRDPEEAARWFRLSAEAGDTASRFDLATLVLKHETGPEEATRTREWFEKEAEGGDLVGAYNYGICLAEGVGVERNDTQAMVWLKRAAAGVVNARYWYGRLLAEGRGGPADPVEGRKWIAQAAEAGMVEALVAMAEFLVNGAGGEKDHPRALDLFERAANSGHVGAMFAVGAMLGGGHDVPWDRPAAENWFRKAAEQGHGYAALMLGRYLARGLNGAAKIEEARLWLTQARGAGLAEAEADLAALPHPDDAQPGQPSPAGLNIG